MKSSLSTSELILEFQTVDFVLKTQRQIAKDFSSSGILFNDLFEKVELSYDVLISTIASKLEEVMMHGETQLLQLLYQIDIPQNHFLDLLNQEDFGLKLSALILRREAYKVYLRSKF
jgi:hypothetical protein